MNFARQPEWLVLELENHAIRTSMDGKGRALGNVYVERLHRRPV